MYALLLAVIYLAFISLGLPDSLLGAGWPVMHDFFGVSRTIAGFYVLLRSGKYLYAVDGFLSYKDAGSVCRESGRLCIAVLYRDYIG